MVRLHRLAALELSPPPSAIRRWTYTSSEGVPVTVLSAKGTEDKTGAPEAASEGISFGLRRTTELPPARLMLSASQDFWCDLTNPVTPPRIERERAERAIAEFANYLQVMAQAEGRIQSPRPYLLFEPLSEEERAWQSTSPVISLPASGGEGGFARVAPGLDDGKDYSGLFQDRQQGMALLAAALAATRPVPKLHELMRLFENAFALAGTKLATPLGNFLGSYPDWNLEYTISEVRSWVTDLRDPATHADLRQAKRIIMDTDVDPYIVRIEQAAYDVLMNKQTWFSPDPTRAHRWSFKAANTKKNPIISTGGGGTLQAIGPWDHFGVFTLNERYRVNVPDEWVGADWYFATTEP